MNGTDQRLAGRAAVVTGAGAGIGRAIALRLAAHGARVVINARTATDLDRTSSEVAEVSGEPAICVAGDITDDRCVEQIVNTAIDRFSRVDVLVNNAGADIPDAPALVDVTDAQWDRVVAVNITSVFRLTRAILPHLAPGASIINMGSMLSLVGSENEVPYSATKGAVLQFTKSLALEVGARGIRVNCVCPGIIDTPMTRSFLTDPTTSARLEAEYAAASPMNRMGKADEVARCVLFLASDDAAFVTGTTIVVDGGATAR